jgi:hypothetical protein
VVARGGKPRARKQWKGEQWCGLRKSYSDANG